jgi:membrane protein
MTIHQFRDLILKAYRLWNEDNATRLAAAFAFYAILAVAPIILFGIAIGSQFLDSGSVRAQILHQAKEQLGTGAAYLAQNIMDSAAKPGANAAAVVVSVALALFAASGLFDQLSLSVSSIWGVGPKKGNVIKNYFVAKLASVIMALVFMTLILAWIGIDSVISYMQSHTVKEFPLWPAISFAVSVAFLTGVFAVAFKALPRGMVAWRDVGLSAFLTAVGFGLSKYLLSLYFGIVGVGAAYGPAGALVVILLWFYYSSQIFFFGVEITFVYAYQFGSHKDETPGEQAVS